MTRKKNNKLLRLVPKIIPLEPASDLSISKTNGLTDISLNFFCNKKTYVGVGNPSDLPGNQPLQTWLNGSESPGICCKKKKKKKKKRRKKQNKTKIRLKKICSICALSRDKLINMACNCAKKKFAAIKVNSISSLKLTRLQIYLVCSMCLIPWIIIRPPMLDNTEILFISSKNNMA